ncbi:MAG: hypothetical protein WDN06_12690 [Asticcacaulis sp.]
MVWATIAVLIAAVAWTFSPLGKRTIAGWITTSYAVKSPVVEWDELFSAGAGEATSPNDALLRAAHIDYYLPNEYLRVTGPVHVKLERLGEHDFKFTFTPVHDSQDKKRPAVFHADSESPVLVLPDTPPADAHGNVVDVPGRPVRSYAFSLDIPDGDYDSGHHPAGIALKPEIQLSRVANMTVGSFGRYHIQADAGGSDGQLRLNQGVYEGTVTAHATSLLFHTRYQLAQKRSILATSCRYHLTMPGKIWPTRVSMPASPAASPCCHTPA